MTPGIIIAAPHSGAGKTTVAIGVMAAMTRAGLRVAPAKVGPDYIDPRFHDFAAGRVSVNLDGWAMRPDLLDDLVGGLSAESDLVVAEGVMGLFDGAAAPGACDTGSTGDLAERTGWPVVLVVDAARQAQSVAALVSGFRDFRPGVRVAGVILNRVGSERHAKVLTGALAAIGMPVFGAVPRDGVVERPARHLGLEQAAESPEIAGFIDAVAKVVGEAVDLEALRAAALPSRTGPASAASLAPLGQRMAIAQDPAFGFSYPHVLDGWRRAGAELLPFSPLNDEGPDPTADAVFLPGGYPELHAGRLAGHGRFRQGMLAARDRGAWIYGECGGFMVLGERLVDAEGEAHGMLGLLPLETRFDVRRLSLGYRQVTALASTPLGPKGSLFRGHEFHYSTLAPGGPSGPSPFAVSDAAGEAIGAVGLIGERTFGSYIHLIDTA